MTEWVSADHWNFRFFLQLDYLNEMVVKAIDNYLINVSYKQFQD